MGRLIDITGQRFGRLTVIERAETRNGAVYWKCLCDCGKYTEASSQHLRKGETKSCGCGVFGIRERHNFDLSGEYGVCTIKDGTQFLFDKEDYNKICNHRWYKDKDGYIFTTFKGGVRRLHRYIIDCPKGMVIDHINRNPYDNRKANLRICTIQQNVWNRKFRGYSKIKDKYRVNFFRDGKNCNILCDTEDEAIKIRRELEQKYRGEFSTSGE